MQYIQIVFEDTDQVAYQCVVDGVVIEYRDEQGLPVSDEGRPSRVTDAEPPTPGWADA